MGTEGIEPPSSVLETDILPVYYAPSDVFYKNRRRKNFDSFSIKTTKKDYLKVNILFNL